jgi:hypothetical protein
MPVRRFGNRFSNHRASIDDAASTASIHTASPSSTVGGDETIIAVSWDFAYAL